MKKITTIALLLIGLSLHIFAQTIPAIKSTVTTTSHKITFVDGVVIVLPGSNTIATRKAAYLAAVKPVVVTPPVVVVPPVTTPVYDYKKTYRYTLAENAYKFGDLPIGPVTSIAPLKGSAKLNYEGTNTPTMGIPYITKDGLLFFQNQLNTYYMAYISVEPKYPNEMWYVWYKPDYFLSEKNAEEPFYTGDFGPNTLRFTNANTPDQMYTKVGMPINKISIYRIRTTKIPNKTDFVNVELWIDGVKQTNSVQVKAWYRDHFIIGAGVNTNNAYLGWAEVFNTPSLTDDQAAKVTAELKAEYPQFDLPIATDVNYTKSGGFSTVSYQYNGKLPEGKTAMVRWVRINGGPETSKYAPEYDGKFSVPDTFSGRAEITVYDNKDRYFGIPSTTLIR